MSETPKSNRRGRNVPSRAPQDSVPGSRPQATLRDPATGRYLDAIYDLACDAQANGRMSRFTDVLAYSLALIARDSGSGGAGDVLERLGWHLSRLSDLDAARREAAHAREEGCVPH
ncbi:MAG: hypothetical protein IT519_05645 [Burkholderiales bacterium]|jgi:hypothetical protein|nr:hypothetical protein [Burkholderiales bacterium]